MFKFKLQLGILLLSLSAFFVSCNNATTPDKETVEAVEISEDPNLDQAKKVFYSLPSPIETAILMKRAGAKYNENLLNSITQIPNYTTTLEKSINLGIYSADLSFVSMFDQSQAAIKYLSATKRLADELGILNAVDQSYIKRMESSIHMKDSLMQIVSETFLNSNAFLKENQQPELAALILAGGWIEGIYLAVQITNQSSHKDELKTRIIDQRLSLETLYNLLQVYKANDNIKQTITELEKIKVIFDNVEVETSEVTAVVDEASSITTIESSTTTSFSDEDFDNLSKAVIEVRKHFTK